MPELNPFYVGYLAVFGAAALACFGGAYRALDIGDADTRWGLVGLLLTSGGWAVSHFGFLVATAPILQHLFYETGLIVGFATVWAWLYFCSAYTGRSLHRNQTIRRLAIAVFATVVTAKLTNPLHELYYTFEFTRLPFPHLAARQHLFYWIAMGLAYALATVGYFMLLELFVKTDADAWPLGALTALTGLPAAINAAAYAYPMLLELPHEPLGVAAFSVGVLFAYAGPFRALRLTEERDAPTLVLDAEGRIRNYSWSTADLFPELERSDALGRPLASVLPRLAEVVRREGTLFVDRRTSPPRYYRVSSAQLGTGGEQLSRVVTLADVTLEERRRRALRRQNDLFAKAQDLAEVGAWEYDLRTEELSWTVEVYRIYDVSMDFDPTLEDAISFLHPDDRPTAREALSRVLAEGASYDKELRLDPQSGEQRWVRIRATPQTEDGEVVRVRGAIQDITDQKRREQDLRDAKEEAERMNRLKSAFLANMSHEIRTPLTSILGFAEAIGAEVAEIAGDRTEDRDLSTLRRFSGLIEKSGTRLLDTLDSILNLSKLEAGEMDLSLEAVELTQEVAREVEDLAPQAQEARVDLRADLPDEELWGRVDPGGLQVVLRNLVSNAVKYTEEGGWVRVAAHGTPETVALTVEDNGVGMNPEAVPELFEAFQQESEGFGREYEGTGLGLAVTKKAVDRMGGTIDVDTEKGTGTRFTVRFARSCGDETPETEQAPAEQAVAAAR